MVTKPGIIFLLFVGALYTTDAQITGWTAPPITGPSGTGTLTFPENQATGDTGTPFAATPSGTDTIASYTLAAGTPFSVDSTSGALSLDSALDYETTKSHTLVITATDSKGNTGIATINVTVTDVNEHDPVFSPASYSSCIADKSPADTTLTTVTATDQDTSQTITYAIVSAGNTNTDFKIDPSSGLIQVNTGKTIDNATTHVYDLVVTAADNVVTIRTVSTTVSVTVADSCGGGGNGDSGAAVAIASMVMLFVSLVVTLF